MESTCAGCLRNLPKKEFLSCVSCYCKYDLECANMSSSRFYSFYMTNPERKSAWICQTCKCNMPKTDNTNTPIRSRDFNYNSKLTDMDKSPMENNITIRRKPATSINDSTTSCADLSILGDTINENNSPSASSSMPKPHIQPQINVIPVEHLECLLNKNLDKKLEDFKKSLISELRTTISSEVSKAINNLRSEMLHNMTTLTEEQKTMKENINKINTKIDQLENENLQLKREIENLQNKTIPNFEESVAPKRETNKKENGKKIVLYGLAENHWESEVDLQNRVLNVFRQIMDVNLYGYIEEVARMGRKGKGSRRPLTIELLSKSMTRYLLQNSSSFKNTGLAISEYLDQESLKQRRQLWKSLIEARQNGQHAIIQNNILIINGKKCPEKQMLPNNEQKTAPQDREENKLLNNSTSQETESFQQTPEPKLDNNFRD